MKQSISEYIASDEFCKRMKRVSAKSRPFGNSTPSEEICEIIAKNLRERKKTEAHK